ncbi:MAG: hypothetical protein KJP02_06870 [Octadecabacter sp.]|nr:hypothetical protein [Octadecabacter sp.]
MAYLFKAKTPLEDEDPQKKLTRFKRCHTREVPVRPIDQGIDPYEKVSRSEHRHVRPSIEQYSHPTPQKRATSRTTASMAAHLHATDPISIDVLHRALPLRCASING